MRLASELTLRVDGATEGEPIDSELLVDGKPSGKRVDGVVLEAAVAWRCHFLLFVTDDCPYEETLGVHLLDARWDRVDSARLCWPYASGCFGELRLAPPDTVRFRFLGDLDWSVELLQTPSWRLPLLREARGVRRPFGFYRRFLVRCALRGK